MPRKLKALPKQHLGDLSYEKIKADIITCALRPGSEVTESLLAARYGMGKAPIRKALSSLSQEGLVSTLPRRGYLIAPITLRAVNEVFDLRLLLEPAAARQAAGNVDASRLRELDAICNAGYIPGDRQSETRFLSTNKAFHVTVARASGNEKLANALRQLLDEMERLFHFGLALRNRTDEMRHEHKALIEALALGDKAKAEIVTIEQIEAARRMVLDGILNSSNLRDFHITLG